MKMPSIHFSLSDDLARQVHSRVKKGNFENPTEYMRHLIRGDVERDKAKAQFDAFINKGLDSGVSKEDTGKMFDRLRHEIKHK